MRQPISVGGTTVVLQRSKQLTVLATNRLDDRIDSSRLLFEGSFAHGFSGRPGYDISDDDERFVVVSDPDILTAGRIDIVLNWFEELKERVPVP